MKKFNNNIIRYKTFQLILENQKESQKNYKVLLHLPKIQLYNLKKNLHNRSMIFHRKIKFLRTPFKCKLKGNHS